MDTAAIKAKLEERLEELEDRLHRIEDDLDDPPNRDWEEHAQESENDEVLQELGQVGLDEIKRIRGALARIEAGTYGICVKCGNEISPERLEVLPATPFCKDCA